MNIINNDKLFKLVLLTQAELLLLCDTAIRSRFVPGIIMGRQVKVCGQIGVTSMEFFSGCTNEPLADN
jgi:hypothetical protein